MKSLKQFKMKVLRLNDKDITMMGNIRSAREISQAPNVDFIQIFSDDGRGLVCFKNGKEIF